MTSIPQRDLEFVTIGKNYGQKTVLRNVSFQVWSGEFVALLGPSGSGKSTLLKLAAGFEKPDAGTVRVQEKDVTDEPPNRRNVNTVFQNYALFPHMTVFDNIAYGPRRKKVPGAEIKARVSHALALVGLAGFETRLPSTLSGGEQQRIAVARALVNRPAVLLLDEPLSALDLKIRRKMQGELKRIHVDTKTTFVFVTHDQEEALALADRVIVMNGGRIEQIGSPEQIYNNPTNPFVADFVGEMNWLSSSSGSIRSPDGSSLTPDGKTLIGVRPERIRLAAAGEVANGKNAIAGKVKQIVFQGSNVTVHVDAQNGQNVRCLLGPAELASSAALLDVGGNVNCFWNVDETLVFPAVN